MKTTITIEIGAPADQTIYGAGAATFKVKVAVDDGEPVDRLSALGRRGEADARYAVKDVVGDLIDCASRYI